MAAAVAVAVLAGTSAFAETRHREETRRRGDARDTVRRERSERVQERQRGDESRNYDRERRERETWRGDARRDGRYERGDARRDETYRRNDSYRDGDRNRSYGRDRSYDRNRSRGRGEARVQPYYHRGPVTRYQRYGGGYRVWLGGARYPFFIPHSHWHRDRFRVGVVINLGGYYRDGYYDYYDGYPYRATSRGDLRGTVESVDYRRDTFVVRNDATGSFVTVMARDRRARDVRPGDYVELSGSWTRSGLFNAYDVDLLDYGYRDRW